MNKILQDAKSSAGAAFKRLHEGRAHMVVDALVGGDHGGRHRRIALAGMILAANLTQEEQAALRTALDDMEGGPKNVRW